MKKLVIAEKPSVAKDIAKVLQSTNKKEGYLEGEEFVISWCLGHLVTYSTPDKYDKKFKKWSLETLPIIPKEFQTEVIARTKKQYMILKKLMHDKNVSEIICATDAGREGELIFRLVYKQVSCKKPVKRLWISSMTDKSIKEGMKNLKPIYNYDNLFASAKSRIEADWLVGLNATRLFSVKYNRKLTVGRVQTPTLNLIVQRHLEILNFKPEPYYQIKANFEQGFSATWQDGEGDNKILDKEKAEKIRTKCEEKPGTIFDIKTQEKSIERPFLFDLTELQREANRKYGYTAQETLNIAQALYEKHKLTTYPRTDSRFLTNDMSDSLEALLLNIQQNDYFNFLNHIEKILAMGLNIDKRVINNDKVTDHHAIIPTENIGNYDIKKLSESEKKILKLIVTRFLVILSEKHIYKETILNISIADEIFEAKGKEIINNGFKGIEEVLLMEKTEKEQRDEQDIPTLNMNDKLSTTNIEILSKKTQSKKPYTESTLLSAMENAGNSLEDEELKESMKERGLGTPATRAAIIEKLIQTGYIVRKGKKLEPTDVGIKFIDLIPEKLKSPSLTGEVEYMLRRIESGFEDANYFNYEMRRYVKEFVQKYKISVTEDDKEILNKKIEKEVIGKCPRCQKDVYEGEKNFYCSGYKEEPKCTFALWKNDNFFKNRGKKITKRIAKALLKSGQVDIKNLKSKAGNQYDAKFIMEDTGEYINFKMEFLNNEK